MNPKLFIGSSVEGLPIAYAIQENLEHDPVDVTVWNQGFFHLSQSTLSDLITGLSKFDLGVFVLSPDDLVTIRSQEFISARDNVIFELGLFFGALGQDKAFYVIPRTEKSFRLPTDLLGITCGTYNDTREDNNLTAALGTFSNQIRKSIWNIKIKPSSLNDVKEVEAKENQNVKTELINNVNSNINNSTEFYSLYNDVFLPIYSDLVALTGDKPAQILVEQENILAHIIRANTNTYSFDTEMNKAINHLYRVTLDSLKLSWLELKTIVDSYVNAEKGGIKWNKTEEATAVNTEYMKKYNAALGMVSDARTKEMRNVDTSTLETINCYQQAVAAFFELVKDIPTPVKFRQRDQGED